MTFHDLEQSRVRLAGRVLAGAEYQDAAAWLASSSTKSLQGKIKNLVDSSLNPSHEIADVMIANGIEPLRLPDNYELERQDVVCGRGKSQYERPGNRRFLDLINKYVESYRSSKHKKHKAVVLCNVVHEVRMGDGVNAARFVKQMDDGSWWEIGDSMARGKAAQAMRVAVRLRAKRKAAFGATNSFPPEPKIRERRMNNPERMRLRKEVAMAQPYDDSPHESTSGSTPGSPRSSTGALSQEALALPECKVSASTGGTSTSSLMVDTNGRGCAAITTMKDQLEKQSVSVGLGVTATTPTTLQLQAGEREPPLGRLWLVVRDTWQPGANTDERDLLWVGRTVRYVYPSAPSTVDQPIRD